MTLSLWDNNLFMYCTYLFLSRTTTLIIYSVLACIFINMLLIFFKAHSRVYLSYILSGTFNSRYFDHYIINYV